LTAPTEASRHGGRLRQVADDALLAVSFLTIVPVPPTFAGTEQIRRSTAWFPAVGASVGVAAGGVLAASRSLVGPTPAAVVAMATLVIVTGGLHVDGLADTADGLGVRGDRQRRLAVMREPSLGSFGVVAIVTWALLVVTALAALSRSDAIAALAVAGAAGRWSALSHAALLPPARNDGLGAAFATSPASFAIATVTAVVLGFGALAPATAAVTFAAAVVGAGLATLLARAALGGRTGDTLGATVVFTEVAALLSALVMARR
jgi:adenosylcobinamide-GDP ribazoletransferase